MAENRLGSLAKQTAIYGLSSIIGRFLNYLLVPIHTHRMAAESGGYGIVTNLYAYTALLLVILTFGMETTFFRFSNKEGVNPNKAFSTAGLSVGFVSLVFLLLVSIFLQPIAAALDYATHPEFVEIMAIIVAFDAFQAILFARLRYENRPVKFMVLKLSFIIMSLLLNLFIFYLAPYLKAHFPAMMEWYQPSYQVGYIFIANLICTVLVTFGFIPEIKKLKSGIDFTLLKQMLNYTWPILLLGLAGILNQVADKIVFKKIVPGLEGEEQLGIYGACVKIAMIMAMITQAFRYAYEPFVFGGQRDKNDKVLQAKVMKYFIIFTLLAFLAVVMYMPILKYLVGEDYHAGLRVVPIVMMAEIFMGIYFNLSFWYKLIDETWWGAIFSAIGCAVLLAINFIFVPKYSYMACAWGGFAGYATCMVLSYFVGQKKAPIPYDLKSAFLYFALAIALFFFQKNIHIESTVWTLVVNTGLLLVFFAFICWKEKDLVNSVMHVVNSKILKKK
ncbi:MAG: lipopolysaccharide biosynthesis protein [Bacteroidales bacterium]|nr:lipopolysaccharide biosynthesis protein [Bacteroidales bacterium]MBR0539455.1 lipopolysaccharide biosynthesis protein [Bacteroidales bacterium]